MGLSYWVQVRLILHQEAQAWSQLGSCLMLHDVAKNKRMKKRTTHGTSGKEAEQVGTSHTGITPSLLSFTWVTHVLHASLFGIFLVHVQFSLVSVLV